MKQCIKLKKTLALFDLGSVEIISSPQKASSGESF